MSQSKGEIPKLTIRNAQRKTRVDLVELAKFAKRVLALCLQNPKRPPTELMRLGEVSILFVSDRRMAALHRRFLGKSGSTDVLTFQHGEIVVSVEMASRNARRFRNSVGGELRLYLVHGLLHLHGFDDRTKADAKKMEIAQRRMLRRASGLN